MFNPQIFKIDENFNDKFILTSLMVCLSFEYLILKFTCLTNKNMKNCKISKLYN